MARAKGYATSRGQHGIFMWSPGFRNQDGDRAPLARRLLQLFAATGAKALAKAQSLRVRFPLTKSRGERKDMSIELIVNVSINDARGLNSSRIATLVKKEVINTIEQESRQGGSIWRASQGDALSHIKGCIDVTCLGESLMAPQKEAYQCKTLEQMADEILAPYTRDRVLNDNLINEAYRLAKLRISKRAQ